MIRQLEIINWRSYGQITLRLKSGSTFIVAPNGVGKTSIVEAARFAVFGRLPNRPGVTKLGADGPTKVIATVELDDGVDLIITRTVETRRGATQQVSAVLGDLTLESDDIDRALADHFGGPIDFLDRLSMVQSTDLMAQPTSVDLRAHLGQLLGIGGIDEALRDTGALLQDAKSHVGEQREAVEVSADEVARLATAADEATDRLATAEQAVADANKALELARLTVRDADRAAALATQALERNAELDAIALDAAEFLDLEALSDDIDVSLAAVEAASISAVDEGRRRQSALQGRIDAVLEAITELSSASGSCPVCRRPLDETNVAQARAGHEADVATWRAELDSLDTAADERTATEVRQLRTRLARLGPPIEVPAETGDPEQAATNELAALAALDEAMTIAARVRAEATAAQHEHTAAADAVSALSGVVTAFEQVATLEAVQIALSDVRKLLLDEGIEPLADAVEEQWARLFENRSGLTLSGDGTMSRSVDGQTLEFGGFSDGERMAAQLLLRIVVLNATTRLPFLWIDEPLEHLDPDARRALALMLARAPGQDGALKQVVMTTYEEPLVRRLVGVVPNSQMHFVRPTA